MHKILDGDTQIIFPSLYLVFPKDLEKGKEYSSSVPIRISDINNKLIDEGTIDVKTTLQGIENTDVLAGGFKNCLRIFSSTIFQTKNAFQIISNITWLAPGIGKVKEWEKSTVSVGDQNKEIYKETELKNAVVKGAKIGTE